MRRYKFHPHLLINVAALPCESQTPKMYLNTNSAFNVNYQASSRYVHQIAFSVVKCSDKPQMNIHFTADVYSVHY